LRSRSSSLTTVGSIGGALFTHYIMFPATIGSSNVPLAGDEVVPRVEDTFELYKNMMIGNGRRLSDADADLLSGEDAPGHRAIPLAQHQIRHSHHLHPRGGAHAVDRSWNQTIFAAAPMIGLYLICIVIAWIVGPDAREGKPGDSTKLRLVFARR